eukprot:TRINITY_DN32635_c0_g1_i1.p4 TRINITY_DN32635_c0_g1~~TRINITY_DN32635_c0_g1_i1.p4  ORF type:complete len:102 (-),score=48.76 TRINITY_DN32635_c0_g1_i1:132-437(-)
MWCQQGRWVYFVYDFFFFSSRRRHTRCREVSWARRCVQETGINAEYMGLENIEKLNNFISGQREIIEDMRDKIEIEETLIQGINKSNNKNKGIEKRIRVKE